MPDWRAMDRKVPSGISFLGTGTITVYDALRYFAWLPRCDFNSNPLRSKTFMTCLEEGNLGMTQIECANYRVTNLCDRHGGVFKV